MIFGLHGRKVFSLLPGFLIQRVKSSELKVNIKAVSVLLALLLVSVSVFGQVVESESGTEEQSGTIVVTIEALRNCDGNVRVVLWASEDGFLRDQDSAFRRVLSVIEGETVEFVFTDLPVVSSNHGIEEFAIEFGIMEYDLASICRGVGDKRARPLLPKPRISCREPAA